MKKLYKKMKKLYRGFTLLETLIAISVSALVGSIVLSSFTLIRNNQILRASSLNVVSALDRARFLSLNGKDSSEYGVHFETNQIVVFKGTVYSPTATDNETIPLYMPITSTNLSGGGSDVYFDRLTGAPNHTSGSVTIQQGTSYNIISF